MQKIQKIVIIIVGLLCFIHTVNSEWIEWPRAVNYPINAAGFLSKFQISTDKPKDNQIFQTQCIFYLKKQIDWPGLSDDNDFKILNSSFQYTTIKNLKQFASDAGHYDIGDNITIGFNFTFENSLNAFKGIYTVYLGQDDREQGKSFDVIYVFPTFILQQIKHEVQ